MMRWFIQPTFHRLLLMVLTLSLACCSPSVPTTLWQEFSGETTLDHVRELVAIGPRPAGSDALEKSRQYIIAELEQHGWTVTRQSFEKPTPIGPITFVNLIATRQPTDNHRIILASHYDTKLFDRFSFVGANDAGSSTAALLEMGRVLATAPALASRCELVFFDGEECIKNYTATDGLFGSRYYAAQLTESNTISRYQCGILLDMVGDKHLRLTLPADSPPSLTKVIFASAETIGARDYVGLSPSSILDDHVPLNKAGIATIDLIDFDFPAWHTADDTLDTLSAQSLETVGQLTLHAIITLAGQKK